MLSAYIEAALQHATVEHLSDSNEYFAEIPNFPGVWASAKTPYLCLQQLREVLEDWIVLKLRKNAALPKVNGLTLPAEPLPA